MTMTAKFSLRQKDGTVEVATIEVTATGIAGAEQDVVLLDATGSAIAIVQLQPGIDRKQI
jgi:hypothetical protein